MKSITIILFIILSIPFNIIANDINGRVAGKIVDKINNETLIGVPVLIEGSTLGSVTDLDGQFIIENVPPGNYNIIFRYIGYTTKIISGVIVNVNQTTPLNIALDQSDQQLKEVTVTAEMKRENIGSILLMQKKSATVQDGISSEAIRKTPDKNSGEVIRRISGASLQEGRFVVIRGLNDRYNNALLNGFPLSSTEPDRKAFAFDLIPSVLLDNIIITKTASPDLPGEFAGGVLQITTKDIPDRSFVSFSAGTGFNSQTTFKDYKSYTGGKKDWLGIDDKTRALPGDFPAQENFKRSTQAEKINYSRMLQNDWTINSESNSPLSQSYQFSFGTNANKEKNNLGLIGAINYNNSRRNVRVQRSDFDFDGSENYNFNDNQYKENIFWGALLNASYKAGNNSKFSIKNLYSINSEDQVINRSGNDIENYQYIESYALKFTSSQFVNSVLSGEHYIPSVKSKVKWHAGYTNNIQSIPDLRRMYYYRNIEQGSEDTSMSAYVPFGNASPNYAGKFYSDLNEDTYNGEASISFPISFPGKETQLKTGYFEQYRTRIFDARVLGYVITNAGQFNYNLLNLPAGSLFASENMGTKGFRVDEITNPSDHYSATANLHAGYVLLDNLWTDNFRAVYGVRVENFIEKLHSMGYSNDTIEVYANYLDILPSINLTYSVSEKSNLRLAGSKTVARPEFRELAPFGFYDFSTATSVVGNDSLERTNIFNLDLRIETFPSVGEILSMTVFYKKFANPIETIIESSGAGSRRISFANAPSAYVIGLEAEYRKKLDFVYDLLKWSQWENISFFGNVALIKSRVDKSSDKRATEDRPLQGQSPYVLNGGISYSHPQSGAGINVVFNRIGKRIYQVGNSGYLSIEEAPRNLLDLQFSKRIFNRADVKFTISDVLNEEAVFYQDQNQNGRYAPDIDSGISHYSYGTNYSLSVSCAF